MKGQLLEPIINIFLPKRCLLCSCDIQEADLCESCRSLCNLCPLGPFIHDPEHVGALFFYELSIRDAFKHAKFNQSYAHARLLINLLKQELEHNAHIKLIEDFAPSALCYVPTNWVRRVFRGLDISSQCAHILARHLKIPLIHALSNTMLKERQSSLQNKSSRFKAVKNLFRLRTSQTRYERLLVIDDIVTTGATLDACMKLLRGISKEVRAFAYAKTP